jgi:hypothetical protein
LIRATEVIGRALPLLALEGPDRDLDQLRPLIEGELADAVRVRMAGRDVEVVGRVGGRGSAAVSAFGPGFGEARVAIVLAPSGEVVVGLCTPAALPAELRAAAGPLLVAGARPPAGADAEARRALTGITAAVRYRPGALPDEHRWWGDAAGLLMLADLLGAG